MKKILLFLAIFSILMFITVGCKSDPEPTPTETPVEEVPPVEPAPEPEVEPTPVPEEPVISEEELLANATKSAENAKSMKEKIENLSLQGYNELSYAAGLVALEGYDKLVEENAGAAEKLATATLAEKKFSEVLNSAFSKLSSEKKAEVKAIREKALEIKSDKADKVGYEAAQLLYTTADEYSELKDYENSYNYYVKALEAFDDVYSNVSAKRQAALEAIERAKNKADDVDEFAAEADKIAPLSTEDDNQGEE
jgi:tetratricopeptide (TPR) repeat protein